MISRLALVWLLVTCIFSTNARGEENSRSVELKAWTVHATNTHGRMDDRLKRIGKHLSRLKYSGFSFLGSQGGTVQKGGKIGMPVPGKREVQLTLLSSSDERSRVRVKVTGRSKVLLDTTVSVKRNGFFIVAGPRHEDGILVLPIFARY